MRRLIGLAAVPLVLAGVLAGCAEPADTTASSDEPELPKQITLLIPYGAGGGTDLSGRLLASGLEKELGAKFVVENLPAGSGQEALRRLTQAKADGSTLAFTPLPATNMMYLDKERGAKFTRDDFVPIGNHDTDPVAIAVSSRSPWKTVDDVVKAAKAQPGKVTAGSNGVLAAGHLGLLRFSEAAGVDIAWSTFEDSGQLRSSVIGQSVDLEVQPVSEFIASHRNGDLRILALLNDKRLPGLDGVPTAPELGFTEAVVSTNRILVAPAGFPQEEVDRIGQAMRTVTSDPAYQAKAKDRLLVLNYLDAKATDAMWGEFDTVFGPMVEQFRAAEK